MKKMFKIAAVISIAGLSLAGCSSSSDDAADGGDDAADTAAEYTACLVSDAGGWDDKSFNESAKNGLDKAEDELGVVGKTAESKDANDFEANVQAMVDEECNLIIGVGFSLAEAIAKAAEENPDINFALVDSTFENPLDNEKALVFNTQESAYLAGYAAAAMSQSGKVGTFGGMKIPSVTIFMDGFAEVLALADELILLDIYPARELPIEGITSQALLDKIQMTNKRLCQKSDLIGLIESEKPKLLVTMGAGDIDRFVEPLENMIMTW